MPANNTHHSESSDGGTHRAATTGRASLGKRRAATGARPVCVTPHDHAPSGTDPHTNRSQRSWLDCQRVRDDDEAIEFDTAILDGYPPHSGRAGNPDDRPAGADQHRSTAT